MPASKKDAPIKSPNMKSTTFTLLIACLIHFSKLFASGNSCLDKTTINFCPLTYLSISDSAITNTVANWGNPKINNLKGQDYFLAFNLPNDSAISRNIRLTLDAEYLSKSTKVYLLWFEDTCGANPLAVDSFFLSNIPGIGKSICYPHSLTDVNASTLRLVIDFTDTLSFKLNLTFGYEAIHADSTCTDEAIVSVGDMNLDINMCMDSLQLPIDTHQIYLPMGLPPTILINDAAPNNNGYVVTIKKVSSNLAIFNHPFQNNVPFQIDTFNQDYCDITISIFLKNNSGREAINGLQMLLDNNFEVVQTFNQFGSFFMPLGPGKYNSNGNWNAVYNQPSNELIWEFSSPNGRGDIDVNTSYQCKVYHFGFRAKIKLTGQPYNVQVNLQGDNWGDTIWQNTCGPRKSGCSFKCPCVCMCKPGNTNFGSNGNVTNIALEIEGEGCTNQLIEDRVDITCKSGTLSCVHVGASPMAIIREGNSGFYTIKTPQNEEICPDSCFGNITTVDSVGCSYELLYSRSISLSTLSFYNDSSYTLCTGDTLVLYENDSISVAGFSCTTYSSKLVDSLQNPVLYQNGKYFITQPGKYFDYHGDAYIPCVTINVNSLSIDINDSISISNCTNTCHELTTTASPDIHQEWFDLNQVLIGIGSSIIVCQSDTQSIWLRATKNSGCEIIEPIYLAMGDIFPPKLTLDSIYPITCQDTLGKIDIHSSIPNCAFMWSDFSSAEDLLSSKPGDYIVTVTSSDGCIDTSTFTLHQLIPSSAAIQAPDTVCQNTQITLCTQQAGQFLWNNGSTNSCTTVTAKANEVYAVTITDTDGCILPVSFIFPYVSEMTLSAAITDVPCKTFYTNGSIDLMIKGGLSPYTFYWSNDATTKDIAYLMPNDYTVTISDQIGCSASSTFSVTYLDLFHIQSNPVLDTIRLGEQTVLTAFATNGMASQFEWITTDYLSCSTCDTTISSPPRTMVYQLLGIDTIGCKDTALSKIVVIPYYDLFLPNVFTPNNDGVNDVWQVFGNLSGIQKLELLIFNRWGEKIIETNLAAPFWDGVYKNEPATPGVYTYVLNVTWRDEYVEKMYRGSITLLK